MQKLLIIIPAYNEAQIIASVLKSLPNKINNKILIDKLVIDDGSKDNTSQIAKSEGAKVVKHLINRGLGAVLATGFKYAVKRNYDIVITFDADGQHRAGDLLRLINPVLTLKADVVIGSRLLIQNKMPFLRKLINLISNIATYVLFNIWTTDSQSGLRCFSKYALIKMKIRSQRMEVSSEIFKEIQRCKLRLTEIPIKAIYTNYSLHKGQRITNASNVFWKLFLNKFSEI